MGLQRRSTGTGPGIVPPPQAILIGGQGQGGYGNGNGGGYGGGYGNGGADRGSAMRRGSYGLNAGSGAGAGMPVPMHNQPHPHPQVQGNQQMAERERASRLFWAGDGTGGGVGGAGGGGGGPPPGGGGGGGLLDEFVPTRQAHPGEVSLFGLFCLFVCLLACVVVLRRIVGVAVWRCVDRYRGLGETYCRDSDDEGSSVSYVIFQAFSSCPCPCRLMLILTASLIDPGHRRTHRREKTQTYA